MDRGAYLVVGAGDGIARAFASEGYTVCMTHRPRNLDKLQLQAQAVAHVILDGPIQGQFARKRVPNDEARLARDEIFSPDDIGRFYVQFHNQPKSTWSYHSELRPWSEKWDWS